MSGTKHTVTLIPGDGIGPEVTTATRRIIDATGVQISWEICEAGAEVFKKGLASGVPQETIASIQKNKVALKGPLETPVGFGEKSANVTLRKLFETFGNIRPVRQFPGVPSAYQGRPIDLVIVRENVEDLYAGIEHMQTPSVAQCLKLISQKGCEKIVRLAFEFARSEGRKKVTCGSKANIMKLTEGLLKRTFEAIAPEYPDIQAEHMIVENCAHQLVRRPEQFDVLVMTNMNGDILSDLSSALVGGLGFAPGANIGADACIFEAVHGSAPKYAGKNVINPTAVLMSGIMMLRHLGEFEAANLIEQSVHLTLEEGKHPLRDMTGNEGAVSTTAYTDAIIANLGRTSPTWVKRDYKPLNIPRLDTRPDSVRPKSMYHTGADIFVSWAGTPEQLGKAMETVAEGSPFSLKMLSNRGVQVYPSLGVNPDTVDQCRCRFVLRETGAAMTDAQLLPLLEKVASVAPWVHIEKLLVIDGKAGYSKAQGED